MSYDSGCPLLLLLQMLREIETRDVAMTSVVMSHSGRMLFAGTTSGALRSIKFPLTHPGEWTEHQGHSEAILKVSEPEDYVYVQ